LTSIIIVVAGRNQIDFGFDPFDVICGWDDDLFLPGLEELILHNGIKT
jgi:hypothetical protein